MFCFKHCIKQSCSFVHLLQNLIIDNFRDDGEEGGCSSRRKRIGGEFAKMPFSSLFSLIIYFNAPWFLSTGFALCDQWQIVEVVITQGYRLVSLVIAKQRPLHRVSDVFFVAGWNQGCHQRPRARGAEVPWTRAFPGEQDDFKNHSKLCTNLQMFF